jgi:outer membrane murein-binding lipoprotein Lpp
MTDAVTVALISGGISFLGSAVSIITTNNKQQQKMDKSVAVLTTKMEDMAEDIKAHNQYAKLFNENIPAIKQHMVDVDRRLDNLERSRIA